MKSSIQACRGAFTNRSWMKQNASITIRTCMSSLRLLCESAVPSVAESAVSLVAESTALKQCAKMLTSDAELANRSYVVQWRN